MEKTYNLEKIGKRMPYTVPDDFFANIEQTVMEEVGGKKTEVRSISGHKKAVRIAFRSLLAVAAAVALFFVVRTTLPKSDSLLASADDYASVELAFNDLSTDDQDFLIAVYEDEEYINELTNTEDYE